MQQPWPWLLRPHQDGHGHEGGHRPDRRPTDQGAHVNSNAWIPFYFGRARYRHELLYKGQGRLVFAGGGLGNLSPGKLIRIIHNADERGDR